MRFWLAVLAGAIFQGLAFSAFAGLGSSAFAIAFIVLTALAVGFFAARRGALAGFLTVYLGNLVFVLINIGRRGLGEDPSDLGGFMGRLLIVQLTLLPYAVVGAIAGWAGARVRRQLLTGR